MKTPREYKHRARFEAVARCVLEPENGSYLAIASLHDLKTVLPADAGDYPDLLPIAGNACVINLGNGNGDMMDTEVGVKIFPQFVHKPINIEHDRSEIVGHITNSALSKFNSNYSLGSGSEIIKPEELAGTLEPFNIAIGGYIYRSLFRDVARKILEANDPDSPEFLNVSLSWELAFDEHKLFVGSKERGGGGEVISDPAKIAAWSPFLKSAKGSGKSPDGRPLYRLVSWASLEDGKPDEDSVLAMGVALTLAPASAVAGVVTPGLPNLQKSKASLVEITTKSENTNEIISQTEIPDVTTNTQSMKVITDLNALKALNDETAKEFSFANIKHVVEAGVLTELEQAIASKSKEWSDKLAAKEQAAASAKTAADEAVAKVALLQASLDESKSKIEQLEAAQQVALANQTFQSRMAHFDENFELSDADRRAISSRIKGLDEAAFAAVAKDELAVFLAPKSKEAIAKQTAVASVVTAPVETAKEVAAAALAAAQTSQTALPNTPAAEVSLKDKYAAAFAVGKGVVTSTKNK